MDGYMGTILPWAGTFAPRNWMFCQGQLLPISNYQALFSLIGTNYGGDGRSTFGLPDLRSRIPVGAGQAPGLSNYTLGLKSGSESTVLQPLQMPQHIHANTVSCAATNVSVNVAIPSVANTAADTAKPGNTVVLGKMAGTFMYSTATPDSTLEPFNATGTMTPQVSITNAPAGTGAPFDNRQPSQAVNFIICVNGLYPARN